MDMSAGPEFRLELRRGKKEIDYNRGALLLTGPGDPCGRVGSKRAGYPQVMGNEDRSQGGVAGCLPCSFTSSNVFSNTPPKRG